VTTHEKPRLRAAHLSIAGTDETPLWRVLVPTDTGYHQACCDGHGRPEDAIDCGVNVIRWALADSIKALPEDSYGAQVLAR
jgi:hypothetical protein